MTKFHQRSRLERLRSRGGYKQSGNFDESGVFGENYKVDDILPKIKVM